MPVYPFRCEDCGKKTEVECSVEAYETVKKFVFCGHCESGNVARLFTTFAIHGFEYPNSVNLQDTEEDYGEVEQKKEIALTMRKLENDGRIDELSKDDQKYYQEYCKS